MSEQIELWQWRYTDDFGKRRIFPCRLTVEDAKRLRDAERVEGSLEIRKLLGSTPSTATQPARGGMAMGRPDHLPALAPEPRRTSLHPSHTEAGSA